MKRMILVLMLFCTSLYADQARVVASSTQASDQVYQSALKLYQEQNFAEAEKLFNEFLIAEPHNKFALYNWGLASYKTGQKGKALAAWRRALNIDPDFVLPLRAMQFAQTEMPSEAFSNDSSGWEGLRSEVLDQAKFDRFFGLSVLLLLAAGFLGVRYFGARHRALRDETPLPPFPTVFILLISGLLSSLFLTGAKIIADNEPRATVIESGLAVRSGPNLEDNSLFELIEGAQVILVRKIQASQAVATEPSDKPTDIGWAQITYPGGLTGWVPLNSIFQTSGRM
jgi:Tfp pilus assembly protein PilF